MAEPFLAEIRIMSFDFPPKGWALCNGQLLPINQNQALFSLLGTTYGGDGRINFAPARTCRAACPIHMGSGHTLGERGGEQAHTLSIAEIPTHTHVVHASTTATGGNAIPTRQRVLGGANNAYARRATSLTVASTRHASRTSAAVQPHLNMQPFLVAELLHRAAGHLPVARTEERDHGTTLRRRDPHVRGQLRARGLDVLRGPAPADLRERDALQPHRHDLRRRRPESPSRSRPARARSAPLRATASRSPRRAASRA